MSEHVLFAAVTALVCLPLSLALAASGLPLTSAALLLHPPKRIKVFRDKYGQQAASCCLLAGLVATLCMGGGAILIQGRFPAAASFWLDWPLPIVPIAAGLVVSAGLAVVYRAAWQTLKNNRAAHSAIGICATLAAWILGYLFLSFLRHFAVSSIDPSQDPALFVPPLDSAGWLFLPCALALSLAMAGASASLYLIYRRDKDDFGRDYYTYALKLASKWALFSTLAAVAVQAGLFAKLWPSVRDLPIRSVFFWGEGLALGSFALACLLWGLVLKSQNPLRLKLHCIVGFVLAWAGLAGMMAAWAKFYFS